MEVIGSSFYAPYSRIDTSKDAAVIEPLTVPAVLPAESHAFGKGTQEALNELLVFSRQLSINSSLEALAPEIARGAVEILRTSFSRVMVLMPNHALACMASFDRQKGFLIEDACRTVPTAAQHLYQSALQNPAPVFFGREGTNLTGADKRVVGLNAGGGLCLAPMRLNTEVVGLLVLGQENEQEGQERLEDKSRLIAFLAEQAAAALYRVNLSGRLKANHLETVLALAKALEARDIHTAGHGQIMMELAEKMAVRLNFLSASLETIRWAALLHDIGKIGIPDDILRRNGPLTSEEWIRMKRHPQIGAEIVMNVSDLAEVAELIHDHHERYDGKGYPRGLAGEAIPLGARIISLVDAYSAMTNGRAYRPACTHAEAVVELKRCSGTNFDPRVVETFLSIYR